VPVVSWQLGDSAHGCVCADLCTGVDWRAWGDALGSFSSVFFLLFFIYLGRVCLCSPGWPGTHDPASVFQLLGLQVCTTPGFSSGLWAEFELVLGDPTFPGTLGLGSLRPAQAGVWRGFWREEGTSDGQEEAARPRGSHRVCKSTFSPVVTFCSEGKTLPRRQKDGVHQKPTEARHCSAPRDALCPAAWTLRHNSAPFGFVSGRGPAVLPYLHFCSPVRSPRCERPSVSLSKSALKSWHGKGRS
jgi:hypothetical protein